MRLQGITTDHESNYNNEEDLDPEQKPAGSAKKKKNTKKKNKNNKQIKKNGSAEEERIQVYLPKPIRVKALTLPRSDSGASYTFDSNSSASSSQEKEEENPGTEQVMLNDDFGFWGDVDQDIIKGNLDIDECQSYFPSDHHGLEKLYEEYLQVLDMDYSHYDLDCFAESLLD